MKSKDGGPSLGVNKVGVEQDCVCVHVCVWVWVCVHVCEGGYQILHVCFKSGTSYC